MQLCMKLLSLMSQFEKETAAWKDGKEKVYLQETIFTAKKTCSLLCKNVKRVKIKVYNPNNVAKEKNPQGAT